MQVPRSLSWVGRRVGRRGRPPHPARRPGGGRRPRRHRDRPGGATRPPSWPPPPSGPPPPPPVQPARVARHRPRPTGPPPPARACHTPRTDPGRYLQSAAHSRGLQAVLQSCRPLEKGAFPIAGGRLGRLGVVGWLVWETTWVLSCIVGESGLEWATRMVMHRGTRVAGLLPPSHPGSDFAHLHGKP